MFSKKLVDKKNDKVEIKIIPKTNKEYISVTYGRIRFIDSYKFLSSSPDYLIKKLVDKSHKTMKNLKEEIVDNDDILNIGKEIKVFHKEDRYENDSIEILKKEYSDEIGE